MFFVLTFYDISFCKRVEESGSFLLREPSSEEVSFDVFPSVELF